MKKLLSVLALFIFVASVSVAQKKGKTAKSPKMEWKQTTIDYGKIAHKSDPLRKFAFTNTGNAPLIITGARGSCGCTVPSYPKKPIMPGEAGVIEVRYDTNRQGKFTKNVRITTNEKATKKVKENDKIVEKETPKTHILYIKGEVGKAAPAKKSLPKKKKSALGS